MAKISAELLPLKKWPSWPAFGEEEISRVGQILHSGKVNYWTGEQGHLFEKEFAHNVGASYAVALMNGTVALEAALHALDIKEGDEVITTPRTFIASASAIVMRGAKPIFADVDPISQNITASAIEPLISKRSKAILVVHVAGWPCDMPKIKALAAAYKLFIIEDCAQATGAKYQGQPVGSWGDVACFSFCQDKIITTGGEGGMITTNDFSIWQKIWAYKDHGKSYDAAFNQIHPPGFRWLHESFGTNWRMTELQAAIGRLQLEKLAAWIQIRQRNANILNQCLGQLPGLRVTLPPAEIQHAYYKYYVFLNLHLLKPQWSRMRIMEAILAEGIPCFTGVCGEIYKEKAFIKAGLSPSKSLPQAEQLSETSLMFLVHPTLTEQNMYEMTLGVSEVINKASL